MLDRDVALSNFGLMSEELEGQQKVSELGLTLVPTLYPPTCSKVVGSHHISVPTVSSSHLLCCLGIWSPQTTSADPGRSPMAILRGVACVSW